jgi:hypothetical protein
MLSQQALDEVLELQKVDGRRLGTLLVERGLVNETQLTQILSHQLSVPWVALLHIEFSRQLLNLVPYEVAERFCLVPIYVRHVRGQGDTLYVAMDDPTNEEPLRECMTYSGLPVRAMIAPPSDIREAIRVCYGIEIDPPHSRAALAKTGKGAPESRSPEAHEAPAVHVEARRLPATRPPVPPSRSSVPSSSRPSVPSSRPPVPSSRPAAEDPRAPAVRPERSTMPSSAPDTPVEVPQIAMAAPVPTIEDEETLVTGEVMPVTPEAPLAASAEAPPSSAKRAPRPQSDADGPEVEAVEIEIPRSRRRMQEPPLDAEDTPASSQGPSTRSGGRSRMVSLTLLDGTTLTLPARSSKGPSDAPDSSAASSFNEGDPQGDAGPDSLTGREVVAALKAACRGGDAGEVLGSNARWEAMFAALLTLLVRKRVITEWELLEELKKI